MEGQMTHTHASGGLPGEEPMIKGSLLSYSLLSNDGQIKIVYIYAVPCDILKYLYTEKWLLQASELTHSLTWLFGLCVCGESVNIY